MNQEQIIKNYIRLNNKISDINGKLQKCKENQSLYGSAVSTLKIFCFQLLKDNYQAELKQLVDQFEFIIKDGYFIALCKN